MSQTIRSQTALVIAATALACLSPAPAAATVTSSKDATEPPTAHQTAEMTVMNARAVTVSNEDSAQDVSDHNALVEEALNDIEGAAPDSVEMDMAVEWTWRPGIGFVRGS